MRTKLQQLNSKKGKNKKENHPPKKKFQKFGKGKKDYSKLKCYCCEKLGDKDERGQKQKTTCSYC